MYARDSLTGRAMEASAWRIMQALYPACRSSPHKDLERRLHKMTEEVGEVAGVYNDIWGSKRKGLTSSDLMEEKVDLFIVATDAVIQHNLLTGGDDPEVAMTDMALELTELLLNSDSNGLLVGSHGFYIRDVVKNLGKAMSDLESASIEVQRLSLASLHTATAQLLLCPEPSDEVRHTELMVGRLPKLEQMVSNKLAKWTSTRALPKAA